MAITMILSTAGYGSVSYADNTKDSQATESGEAQQETTEARDLPEQKIEAENIIIDVDEEDFELDVELAKGDGRLTYESLNEKIVKIEGEEEQSSEATETTETTKETKATEPTKEAETTKPADSAKTDSSKQVKSTKSVKSAEKTTEAAKSTKETKETEATKETETTKPTEPSTEPEKEEPAKLDLQGKTGTVKIKITAAGTDNYAETTKTIKVTVSDTKAPVISEIKNINNGVRLTWNYIGSTSKYKVYRKASDEEDWKLIKEDSKPENFRYVDTSATNGKVYTYAVTSTENKCESEKSKSSKICYLKPVGASVSTASSTSKTFKWDKNTGAKGYEVQYSTSRLMFNKKKKTIKTNKTTSYTAKNLSKNKKYFARIRAYKTVDNIKYYSAWSLTSNTKDTYTASIEAVKHSKTVAGKTKKVSTEIRTSAGQSISGYGVMQGGCTDGTYAYYALVNKSNNKVKIAKQKLSSGKIVAVSDPMAMDHANDMTYDSKNKRLVVTHNTEHKKRVSFVSTSLKYQGYKDISIPSTIPGATKAQRDRIYGFASVSYSDKNGQYVAVVSGVHDFVILNKDLKITKYIPVTKKYENTYYQGADVTASYIIVAQSPHTSGLSHNVLTVYDWDGNFISRINVRKAHEIESVFHKGNTFYAGFYCSYVNGKYKRYAYTFKFKL